MAVLGSAGRGADLTGSGRQARFYELTPDGEHRLDLELQTWRQYSEAIERAVSATGFET